jgi:hypothetical protein
MARHRKSVSPDTPAISQQVSYIGNPAKASRNSAWFPAELLPVRGQALSAALATGHRPAGG